MSETCNMVFVLVLHEVQLYARLRPPLFMVLSVSPHPHRSYDGTPSGTSTSMAASAECYR